tara:strand:+ start:313 stop:1029 length:717 start_codon:yes stop_codon:yes gene_type:complete
MTNLSIIIPCYNEEKNIHFLFKKIENLLNKEPKLEVIIVDNGSTDSTQIKILNSSLYTNHKIKIINIKKNFGYGHGIMSGVKVASGKFIGWCHADLQTDPKDVYDAFIKFKDKLDNEKVIIKGRRINRNLFDNFFTICMSIFASIVFHKIINDINAQPKIFSRLFLTYMNDYPNDFSLDLYLLVIAKNNSYKIINYDVEMKDRIYGQSKGGGTIKGKIKLTLRTLFYIMQLRKKIWNS